MYALQRFQVEAVLGPVGETLEADESLQRSERGDFVSDCLLGELLAIGHPLRR